MSKIAEALAKAKERTGTTTAPFLVPGGVGASNPDAPEAKAKAKALRKARNTQLFWIILLSVSAVLTALVIWNRLKTAALLPSEPPVVASDPAPAESPPIVAAPGPVTPTSGPVSTVPVTNTAAAPRADLYNTVNALVITAVLPGESPRLMHQGRIVAVGEPVEGELVFRGVQDGKLVFQDRRGAVYLRRY